LSLGSVPVESNVANLHGHVLENDVGLLLQVFLDGLLHGRFGMNSTQPLASDRPCQPQSYKAHHYRPHANLLCLK
jgi:hypothetical protein